MLSDLTEVGGGGVVDVLKEHLCYSMYIELCYYTFTNISTRTKKSYYTKRLKFIDSKDNIHIYFITRFGPKVNA